jgi:preprotein translocase subunit SecA
VRNLLPSWFKRPVSAERRAGVIAQVNLRRRELRRQSDEELKDAWNTARTMPEGLAVAAVFAERSLGLDMFDVQLQGSLALADGKIAEMQTGEGKTLTAVPSIAWIARAGKGVHVMTVNDYLARRDARWMSPIYEFLGLSVGCIQQNMSIEERKRAYVCDITYATANEVGFDYLRDQSALYSQDQVHRPFAAAVIDEVDSLLIDEARIPLVLAGGQETDCMLSRRVDELTRRFTRNVHYQLDEYGRNVVLTDRGVHAVESAFGCENLFAQGNLGLFTAVQDSLHAHALLRRNVDYLVKDGAIESIDEFKGRIAKERRWPAGLHGAIEAKEGIAAKEQGRILGSITIQNLVALYPVVCGMTGTAATQAEEFCTFYGLEVEVIPTNRPVIRRDASDKVFQTKRDKEQAVVAEIHRIHQSGRPVLVGTASVEESERLSASISGIRHQVLNARNEEEEAGIIADAGKSGAVTISTNMAGRGVDIRLGDEVAALGGLQVIGTNRHESRRIDHQLRGRAGRQGDPGGSQFFVSLEDDLLVKYGIDELRFRDDPDSLQRLIEGQNLDIRQLLRKYEGVVEGQRQIIQQQRQDVLTGATPSSSELERLVSLTTIDDLWSEHLAAVADLRVGSQWVSWGGRDPLSRYLNEVHRMFGELQTTIATEIPKRLADAESSGSDPSRRGATWTYLTTDQPFGSLQERFVQGCLNRLPALQAGLQSTGSWIERLWHRWSQELRKRGSRLR